MNSSNIVTGLAILNKTAFLTRGRIFELSELSQTLSLKILGIPEKFVTIHREREKEDLLALKRHFSRDAEVP